MGALNPLFLLAGLAVAVPIILHLFHRQETRRISFPALRYLERTEKEHARRIRTRQLLLLLVRVAALLLLVGAGARLFIRGKGSAHPPTALAIVLDNSLSTGRVEGDRRTLDELRDLALRTLDAAGEDDRIWVVRTAEPWRPAVPTGPAEARRFVEETTPSDAGGDLSAALRRAAQLVATSGLPAREIQLLSDLQATGFHDDVQDPAGDVPVVVWAPDPAPVANHGLTAVLVGGGLPPMAGQRSQVTVDVGGSADDTVPVPVRILMDERVRGAGAARPGTSLTLPLPPAPAGWVTGYADADPDALRADDRRYFAFRTRPAPKLAVQGDPGLFVTEAVGVLEAAQRVTRSGVGDADAVVAAAGEGLTSVRASGAVLVVPPADPTLLPATNRRLAEAGVPWRLERREGVGETDVTGTALPEPLVGVRARSWYRLTLAGDPPSPPHTLARAGADPWVVEGSDARGRRYLLLASPLDAESSSLPVSAEMVRFLDWFTGEWAAAGTGPVERMAGTPLSAPRGAERVRLPSGDEVPVDATLMVQETGRSGLYTFLAGDSVLDVEAVNPPVSESRLAPADRSALDLLVGEDVTAVRRNGAWDRAIFRQRQGPELWRPFLLLALILLLVEAGIAAAGRTRPADSPRSSGEAARGTA